MAADEGFAKGLTLDGEEGVEPGFTITFEGEVLVQVRSERIEAVLASVEAVVEDRALSRAHGRKSDARQVEVAVEEVGVVHLGQIVIV